MSCEYKPAYNPTKAANENEPVDCDNGQVYFMQKETADGKPSTWADVMVLPVTTQLTPGIAPKRTILAPLRASRVLIHFQVKKRPASVMIRKK